jgi:hypothetical protein
MPEGGDRLRAWTLVDELVLDVFVLTRKIAVQGYEDLPIALRGAALQAALKVVHGVHGGPSELAICARSALGTLAEFRYYLYLCRRLGLIDVRRYRAVALRLEKTQKCLREHLAGANGPGSETQTHAERSGPPFEQADGAVAAGNGGP